jgi:transcriptional regulator with XRE-family HTH domain
MTEVKRLRTAKGWSAERLADEMTQVGIPWTRDAVTNLETGRRTRLAAHEVLALAYVLDAESPVDLLVPRSLDTRMPVPVTPAVGVTAATMRDWFEHKTGPLRQWLAAPGPWADAMPDVKSILRERAPNLTDEDLQRIVEFVISLTRSHGEWVTDGSD